jgi:hypothetical protein
MQRTRQHSIKFRLWQTAGRLAGLAGLLLCLAAPPSGAAAQSSVITWSPPENLSNTPQSSSSPAIIADDYGNVHVFWSEDMSGSVHPILAGSGDTIYYTRWDGQSWSKPVDILFAPNDPIADQMSVAIDKQGYLHLVWTGLTNFYYSKARAAEAGSARAWQEPVVIATNSARTLLESSVAVDANGAAHILYATRGDDPGIYHVESGDGVTWSEPQKLSEPFDSLETSFSRVKIIADGAGRLHSVWQTSEVNGYGQAVYYARSIDGGKTWTSPRRMAYRQTGDFDVSWPYIMAVGASDLHLIYTGGSDVGALGRYEQVSSDGGETWSAPQHIIPEMIGINGYVIPVVDGAGQLHLIINMRPVATQVVGIYYSSWLGDRWSPVVPLVNDIPAAESAHYAAVAVARGNEIDVVWNQIRGGEIWHVRGVIRNVAPSKLEAVPAIALSPTPVVSDTMISTRITQSVSVNVNPRLTTTSISSAANSPLIPAVIASLAIIVIMAVVWRARLRRRA